jgi:hypothetical protein
MKALLTITVLLAAIASAMAKPPPIYYLGVECAASQPVSLYTLPNGQGAPLTSAGCPSAAGGGRLIRVDATVTVTVRDETYAPLVGVPAADLWLVTEQESLVICPGGTIADDPTDEHGRTTFTQALAAGGASNLAAAEKLTVEFMYYTLERNGVDVFVNSPDLNGDLIVNLSDVVSFTGYFYGPYDYAADFYWDGVLNLADVALMAAGMLASCP